MHTGLDNYKGYTKLGSSRRAIAENDGAAMALMAAEDAEALCELVNTKLSLLRHEVVKIGGGGAAAAAEGAGGGGGGGHLENVHRSTKP